MSLASKLQLKPEHRVVVLDAPDGVDLDLGSATVVGDARAADAFIAFVAAKADLDDVGFDPVLDAARRDSLTWVAYPKGGRLGTDLNRDVLAALLVERGVQPVRQVSVDDTWSALRFRPGA